MTREEAIQVIEDNRPTSGYQMLCEALDLAVKALREQEQRRWIPVTERMPHERESFFAHYKDTDKWSNEMFMTISELVIVCAEYESGERIIKTGYTTDGTWKVKDSFYPCRVTHWMPLTEPPKEESEC